ncbi:MAG: hypothetical protein KDE27_01280 [Planctomycetes bacterium]|nr:hypothetical protein [Planctomycetota bacterium]
MPRSTRLGGRVAAALFSTPLALQLSVSFHLAAALGAQIDWRQQNTFSVTPVGRDFAAMAYDPAAGGLLLFGGQATGAITSQNLRWTSVGWQRLTPAVSPPPRSGHALASDTSRNVIVLFGGWDGTVPGPNMPFQYFDDTWEWNGSNWLQRSPVIVPTARHLHVMAYDSARRRTVLTSGWTDRDSGRLLYDTWEWDGTAWGERTPVHPAPAFSGATMAYDAARRVTVLTGTPNASAGGVYLWDGADWSHPFAPGFGYANGTRIVYDAARERIVLFGGGDTNGVPLPVGTWDWDGQLWTQRATATAPPPRYWHALAYDPMSAQVVVFGGRGLQSVRRNDTWILSATNPALAVAFGSGCAGSQGVLTLSPSRRPWLGDSYRTLWTNTPPGAPFLIAFGGTDQVFGSFTLPLALAPFGMPGCSLLVAPETVGPTIAPSTSFANEFAVPNDPSLLAQRAFLQGFAFDPGANAAGFVASNGLALTVGAR